MKKIDLGSKYYRQTFDDLGRDGRSIGCSVQLNLDGELSELGHHLSSNAN